MTPTHRPMRGDAVGSLRRQVSANDRMRRGEFAAQRRIPVQEPVWWGEIVDGGPDEEPDTEGAVYWVREVFFETEDVLSDDKSEVVTERPLASQLPAQPGKRASRWVKAVRYLQSSGEIEYISKNKVKLIFSGGFSGKAYLN